MNISKWANSEKLTKRRIVSILTSSALAALFAASFEASAVTLSGTAQTVDYLSSAHRLYTDLGSGFNPLWVSSQTLETSAAERFQLLRQQNFISSLNLNNPLDFQKTESSHPPMPKALNIFITGTKTVSFCGVDLEPGNCLNSIMTTRWIRFDELHLLAGLSDLTIDSSRLVGPDGWIRPEGQVEFFPLMVGKYGTDRFGFVDDGEPIAIWGWVQGRSPDIPFSVEWKYVSQNIIRFRIKLLENYAQNLRNALSTYQCFGTLHEGITFDVDTRSGNQAASDDIECEESMIAVVTF